MAEVAQPLVVTDPVLPPDDGQEAAASGDVDEVVKHDEIVGWVKDRMPLPGYAPERHWSDNHDEIVVEFIWSTNTLHLYAAMVGDELVMASSPAALTQAALAAKQGAALGPSRVSELLHTIAYFLRREGEELTAQNVREVMRYGVISGQAVNSLMRLLQGVFGPKVFARQQSWPESIKNDLTSQFHRFMASLVETSNQAQGKTVLYLPQDLVEITDTAAAAANKSVVQHLESVVIQWTRQIKGVVNNHDNALTAEILGPLQEVEFWRSRTVDLSGISEQLSQRDVQLVVSTLEAAKSSYLKPFLILSQHICQGSLEANDNLRFLERLTPHCRQLAAASPSEVPALLPGLLASIRAIWNLSLYYNTDERLTGLLRKISNEIIRRCCAHVHLGDLFDGRIDSVVAALNESRRCGEQWKAQYRRTAALVRRSTTDAKRHWDFDDASIFAQIDAFVQRCCDLLEICEGQAQFARRSSATDGAPGPLPEFGGTRGEETAKALLGIQASFELQIEALRNFDYDILDVKAPRWHDDYNAFKNVVKDLEVMYTNVVNTAFEGVTRVADAVALLEMFYSLARRSAIKEACLKKLTEVYQLFIRYVEAQRRAFDDKRRSPPLRPSEPQFAGAALWAHSLTASTDESWEMLRSCRLLGQESPQNADGNAVWERCEVVFSTKEVLAAVREAEAARAAFATVISDFKTARYQAWVEHLQQLSLQPLAAGADGAQGASADEDTAAQSGGSSVAALVAQPLAARLNTPLLRRTTTEDEAAAAQLPAAAVAAAGGAAGAAAAGTAAAAAAAAAARARAGRLVCGFDPELLALFTEVEYWESFQGQFSVPYIAHDVCNQRETLRAQREHVMLVVRAYNRLLDDLTPSERKVFSDHLRRLDKRVQQGISKLTWSTKGIVEFFVRDCCNHAAEVHALVHSVHAHKEAVQRNCRHLGSLVLIRLDKSTVYDDHVFSARQAPHCEEMRGKMSTAYENIATSMKEMFAYFREGTAEVKREWRALLSSVDKDVEAALRQAVRRSLQELSRAINGDAKTEPQTLFKVNIVLEGTRVDYRPTMINLTHVVNLVAKELIGTVTVVPRIKVALAERRADATTPGGGDAAEEGATAAAAAAATVSGATSFYHIISNDEDTLKIVVQIMNGMSASATELQKYLSYWDKYKYIWENDKDGFTRRYAKANRGLTQFDADISRYKELQTDIQNEEVTHTINFIKIDCTSLKAALVGHCMQWQGKLTGLLNSNAKADLKALRELFETTTTRLRRPPTSLDELNNSCVLLDQTKGALGQTEARIAPVEDTYAVLAKFEVHVSEEEQAQLAGLRQAAAEFGAMLTEVEASLGRSKVNMRRDLELGLTSYQDAVLAAHRDGAGALPTGADLQPAQAFQIIHDFKARVASIRETQASLQAGLDVFGMDSPEHPELKALEKDIDLLEQVWGLAADWEASWDGWKTGFFANLDAEAMEAAAAQYNKKLTKLGRDTKRWRAWESLRDKVDQFRATMPLFQDLKNPALRKRHWDVLRREVGRYFDPEAPDFNLEAVFALGLHSCGELVRELSANANKELSIEHGLNDIAERWNTIDIDVGPYKDIYHKVRSTDDLFQALEDDSVQLSTIKASKFYNSFSDKIDKWEATLNTVSEAMDVLLNVQRKWMYLESIFMASEDICKQLPAESALFHEVNRELCAVMERIARDPSAVRALCSDAALVPSLTDMDTRLETIQKSLDQYLETKRVLFPRLYFVSDDDLLEILGQGRDPPAVQRHLKKCFEGIKSIALVAPGARQSNKTWEALSMTAPDGETVELAAPLVVDGPVELWLGALEAAMRLALQKSLAACLPACRGKKDKWVRDFPGQLLITAGAIQWTADCGRALGAVAGGDRSALKHLRKKQVGYLNKLSDMVRGQLTRIEREKLVALITMEIHNRDVMERMVKVGCSSTQDFEWLAQLRFSFSRDEKEGPHGLCSVRQTNSLLEYSYEYQGNNGRLVVTPLTDRCVLTLTTAMFLHRGGNPLGPAGTGKTETVKDLGKNLGKYVVVINCSDGMDYKSVGRVFSGLVQSGSWGCFDEFNRIKIEVISVVAMQVLSIVTALSAHQESFMFMGTAIRCNRNCGIFITMNPGYAGRTELPDNLKALMRPVAMMTPDLAMIAEVVLAAEGFREARILAKKTVTLYGLMTQQLSKQDHYDYGLRNLKAVLSMAGALKRANPVMNEEAILMRALRDTNLPKFIKDDERLFRLLLGDLFPSLELPVSEYTSLQTALEEELAVKGLQKHPFLLMKMIQLYDSKLTRHCNMLVGRTLSGKSVAWQTLMNAKTAMNKAGVAGAAAVTAHVINPKSVTLPELYGAYDLSTFEWSDGILSTVFKQCADAGDKDERERWITFDGPVDALWIESMNSVMDDNKILTLINGDRIPLTPAMSLLFEVEDLAVASPATVSRAGMVFLDVEELGWKPFVRSWLQRRFGGVGSGSGAANAPGASAGSASAAAAASPAAAGSSGPAAAGGAAGGSGSTAAAAGNATAAVAAAGGSSGSGGGGGAGGSQNNTGDAVLLALHEELFSKYVEKVLAFREANCSEPVATGAFCAVQALCALYDALCGSAETGLGDRKQEGYAALAEKWFVFALIWSVMGSVDEASRAKLDAFLRDVEPQFPPSATVYDYCVDAARRDWAPWEARVPPFRPRKNAEFHELLVPTVDTTRNGFVVGALALARRHVLVVGASGTGKTVLASSELGRLPDGYAKLRVSFSATTDAGVTQATIERAMEKRSKDKMGPAGGKLLAVFIDDFNMPVPSSRESPFQPPLELLRFWMDYGGWYDREKCSWRSILDTQLVCAMAPPGGARSTISPRTQSRFCLLNITFPSDATAVKIFESILAPKLGEFENEVRGLGGRVAAATLKVYQAAVEAFLPTPSKSHYLFNMRDVAKVVEGVMQGSPRLIDTKEAMARLWAHECQRAFADRFVRDAQDDAARFRAMVDEQLKFGFETSWNDLFGECEGPANGSIFTALLTDPDEPVYEEQPGVSKLRLKLDERLEDYNMEPKLVPMRLVLFGDAAQHVARIHRVLSLKRGNLLLVGVGGSGRQSLARLAAFVAGHQLFTIEISKNYRLIEFREDLKRLFEVAGVKGKPVTFLLCDNQVKQEAFLEDVNNILQSGEVPNLYPRDELANVLDGVRKDARTAGVDETAEGLWRFFVERVRNNLHVVLCMSPVGDGFRNRTRMFPGLVNCTTIDWFHKWPADALVDVAARFIQDVKMDDEADRARVAGIFSGVHTSVEEASARMLAQLKRHNYVTPTNYLELVKGYKSILGERRDDVRSSCSKLQNGLTKLEEARAQVESMTGELEVKRVVVAQAQKDCEELLVEIVSERRVADEQKKQVEAESEKIGREEADCQAIANDAQADLAVAMPALEKAMGEVEKLDKNAITEVKAYAKPPPLVETVLAAVMTLMGKATDWGTAKKVLGEGNFLQQVKGYDKDNVSNTLMNKIKKYVTMPDFTTENVAKVSSAAAALCTWVHAIHVYASVFRDVAPKRARLKEAQETLIAKQAGLRTAQEQLAEVVAKVAALKTRYDASVAQKNALMEESAMLQEKLERADKLVTGLGGEYVRWQASIGELQSQLTRLVGDSMVAAAFLSYAGPFDASARSELVGKWLSAVKSSGLPYSEDFTPSTFLAKPTEVRQWNLQGLPRDDFSSENGVMATRGGRWPLMIDPQGQAHRWIKNMEGDRLRVIDLGMKDYLRELGNCISYGLPCLLQDVLEELDPAIEPVLSRAVTRQGGRAVLRLGDKEIDWSPDFKLYITTKLGNPHYTPEVSTKTIVVNFSVKQQGLEAQLLGIVVQKERPALEEQSSELTVRVAAGKKKLVELEDEILRLLSESKGSLLDDVSLVDALQQSKTTSEEVTRQLEVAEETAAKIDVAREGYRAAAVRASVAFFVLDDLARVDPMYQFSLDSYVRLFHASIDASRSGAEEAVADRCATINKHHTLAVYQHTCRGLFERHKLLFALQLCFRVMARQGKVPAYEFSFFLYGGGAVVATTTTTATDTSARRPNPCRDWMDETAWENVSELDRLPTLAGLAAAFEQAPRDWRAWFTASRPEDSPLPGDWEAKCSDLQRLCVVRALRPDRVLFAASAFVSRNLGPAFVDPPPFDLKAVYAASNNRAPLVFVLSPGVDPTAQVQGLAASLGVRCDNVALGQGQAPTALRMISEGARDGNWVFLANCHLMLSWMPELEKIVEGLCAGTAHARFRLWLSAAPDPNFPISILQRAIKTTTEPPSGLRANLATLYNQVTQEQFDRCRQQRKYKKLLFGLCWFHAVLLERRKFKSLGFNIPYDFNESDFSICHDLITVFLDEYPEKTPFDAMRYLIAEANYGGRVTDDWDRRLVNVYINQFICPSAVDEPNYVLSELREYFIPSDGDLASYKEYIRGLPKSDHPAAFGQHPNADVASLIEDTGRLLETMVSLQPKISGAAGGESPEARVLRQAAALEQQVPEPLDLATARANSAARSDPEPMRTVLQQETDRYNRLLATLRRQLSEVQKAVQGLAVVTTEIEEVMESLLGFRVPRAWGACYPSVKPLGAWMADLGRRVEQVRKWGLGATAPKVFWLPGMTYPMGFLTALLQTSARHNGVAIDTLGWEFSVLGQDAEALAAGPQATEGAYCDGLYLEGARWNRPDGCLEEPLPMELFSAVPAIHFKPVESKKKAPRGTYTCPIYMYPVRTGTRERPSFVIAADLPAGKLSADAWAKRGVALLLSTAT